MIAMTPRQARRILRESNRRERRATFRGIYKYSVDGGLNEYVIDRHGIPTLIADLYVAPSTGALDLADVLRARDLLDAAPIHSDQDRHVLSHG